MQYVAYKVTNMIYIIKLQYNMSLYIDVCDRLIAILNIGNSPTR